MGCGSEVARKEVNVSTPVETVDKYWFPWFPIRAFTNGYVNNRAAMQRLPIDWIGDTRKSGREINETKAGVNLLVLRKKSILLQVGQFH